MRRRPGSIVVVVVVVVVAVVGLGACRGRLPSAVDGVDAGFVVDEFAVVGVDPAVVDDAGGSVVVVSGAGLAGAVVDVDGVAVDVVAQADDRVVVRVPALAPGAHTLFVRAADGRVAPAALTAWNPTLVADARVFDAAFGVEVADDVDVDYFWQRLTANIGDAWRVRDGNSLNWLPSAQRMFMVAGWNGFLNPDGFADDPDIYPPQNTTTEIWSSVDGVDWRLERPHGDTQFERRHSHNTVLFQDALWMIGGDFHQGKENHDVVTSSDGVHWREVLGPNADAEPPWSRRVLQMSGVYQGFIYTAGGQNVTGILDDTVYHNDVWRSADGTHWEQVVADAPASDTRWAGCGVMDGLVEFHGRLWLVGCARERSDAVGHSMSNAVWSTTDGAVWTRHGDPPWVGRIWHNVVVFHDKLFVLFGYHNGDLAHGVAAGNSNEAWWSDDGETWHLLPIDAPVPGSHAQGVTVTPQGLVYAGGNYSFGFGDGVDKSAWRLIEQRGHRVARWQSRDARALALVHTAIDGARAPLVVDSSDDGSGGGGVFFDGSTTLLALTDDAGVEAVDDLGASGFTVAFAVRAPHTPSTWGYVPTYNPAATLVGSAYPPRLAVGHTDGRVSLARGGVGDDGNVVVDIVTADSDIDGAGAGDVHVVVVRGDGAGGVRVDVDGVNVFDVDGVDERGAVAWSRLGGGLDGAGEGPMNRFAGDVYAVTLVPRAWDDDEVATFGAWARGRIAGE
jgi:hypothetical protein